MSEGKDMGITNFPELDICERCKKRPASVYWTENTMSFLHGQYEEYCEICAVEEQLEFAKERAAKIPELEAKLKELLDSE